MTSASWIFGYGSLIWRPEFSFAERRVVKLRGWARRFWQASPDHRGVPAAPGRVVTLRRRPGSVCWGMAYRLEGDSGERVLAQLDYREKAGYERYEDWVCCADGQRIRALFYVAPRGNPDDLGPAPLLEIARQVCTAVGPSGTNVDYVLRLNQALVGMGVVDSHVAGLARMVNRALNIADPAL